jgi:hypothetical protein
LRWWLDLKDSLKNPEFLQTMKKRLTALFLTLAALAFAQDSSVKAGINDKFLDPKLNVEPRVVRSSTSGRKSSPQPV